MKQLCINTISLDHFYSFIGLLCSICAKVQIRSFFVFFGLKDSAILVHYVGLQRPISLYYSVVIKWAPKPDQARPPLFKAKRDQHCKHLGKKLLCTEQPRNRSPQRRIPPLKLKGGLMQFSFCIARALKSNELEWSSEHNYLAKMSAI